MKRDVQVWLAATLTCAAVWSVTTFRALLLQQQQHPFAAFSMDDGPSSKGNHFRQPPPAAAVEEESSSLVSQHQRKLQEQREQVQQQLQKQKLSLERAQWKQREAELKLQIQTMANEALKQEKVKWQEQETALRREMERAMEKAKALQVEKASWAEKEAALRREIAEQHLKHKTTNDINKGGSKDTAPTSAGGRVMVGTLPSSGRGREQRQQQQQQPVSLQVEQHHQRPTLLSLPVEQQEVMDDEEESLLPLCRVAIENRFAFHLELFESVALLHPLPWQEWERNKTCDTSKGYAVVDLALAAPGSKSRKRGKFDWENPSFQRYFYDKLQNRAFRRRRRDDSHFIRYGEFVNYDNYQKTYHAVIGMSCSESSEEWVEEWLRSSPRKHSCVLHRQFYVPHDLHDQTCFVHPAWGKVGRCFYLPTVLPRFRKKGQRQQARPPDIANNNNKNNGDTNNTTNTTNIVKLCVTGARRAHSVLAQALQHIQGHLERSMMRNNNETSSLVVHVLMRAFEKGAQSVVKDYAKRGVSRYVRTTLGADFITYEEILGTTCDAILPLVDPVKNPMYFAPAHLAAVNITRGSVTERNATQRLSGSITKAVGYKLPVILHAQLEEIYRGYWTAPAYTYTTVREFGDELLRFLTDVGAISTNTTTTTTG